MNQKVNEEMRLESEASCVVKRKHWSETAVERALSKVNEDNRPKSFKELRDEAKVDAKVVAKNKIGRLAFVAIKTGYYNRIDSDNYEQFAAEEVRNCGNGEFN